MDKWNVLHVKTGWENPIKSEIIRSIFGTVSIVPMESCIVPRRLMNERVQGNYHKVERTLFPGYVFLKTFLNAKTYYALTNIPGVIRLIGEPQQEEMDRVLRLTTESDLIGISKVFSEGNNVKVISGPLLGMEGQIIKLDKRKGRAKVNMSLFGEQKVVELSIIMIQNLNS
jgi:transcriptional antiterminator NusG